MSKPTVSYRLATTLDIPEILEIRYSPEARQELIDMGGTNNIREVVQRCLDASRVTWVIEDSLDGIIGVFGLGHSLEGYHPWYVASPLVHDRHWMAVAKESRQFVNHWRAVLPKKMTNMAWAENTRDLKWLKWLGFSFSDDPVEINGHQYIEFEMKGGS